MLSGTAVNRSGSPEASMGVDAGDFDGDGDLDLFMTHRDDETNTLYVNEGNKWFSDKTNTVNLGEGSLKLTGFGTRFADFDNDGFLDLFVANGAVTKLEELSNADHPHPFDQPNQLFHNEGGMTFRVSDGEDAVGDVATSRGAAFGDIDNDGDVDIIVSNNHGPAQVLINQVGEKRSWIGFQLSADDPATVLPARLTVVTDDSRQLVRRAARDGSYASSNDPRVIIGLDDSDDPVSIEIQWATGETTSHDKFEVGKYHKVIRPRQDDVAIGSDG